MCSGTSFGAHVAARAGVYELRVISEVRDGFVMVLDSNAEVVQTRTEVLNSI